MAKEFDTNGLQINTFYGPRNTTEGWVGNIKTEGVVEQLVLVITGDNFAGACDYW
jgi:hypothetical protein